MSQFWNQQTPSDSSNTGTRNFPDQPNINKGGMESSEAGSINPPQRVPFQNSNSVPGSFESMTARHIANTTEATESNTNGGNNNTNNGSNINVNGNSGIMAPVSNSSVKKEPKTQHFVLPSISDLSGDSSRGHGHNSHVSSGTNVTVSKNGNPMLPHQPLRLPSVANSLHATEVLQRGLNSNSLQGTNDTNGEGNSKQSNHNSNNVNDDPKGSVRKTTSGFSVASFDNPLPPKIQQDTTQNPQYQSSLSPQQQVQQQAAHDSYYRPLNVKDALSYLEQVKFQFNSRPDVYNHFLDIMKDFKSQAIDTPGVIERVSTLFRGFPNLIQGFNTFLPQGYRIECSTNPDEPIRVTTPMGSSIVAGTTDTSKTFSTQPKISNLQQEGLQTVQSEHSEQDIQNTAHLLHHPAMQRQMQPELPQEYSNHMNSQVQSQISEHGQNQPQIHDATQPTDSNKKTADVEFSQAISYVNKIKNRFADQPDIYKHFLEILQTYQREQKPINEVYAQVTILFQNAPDLLDDFKKFLPDSSSTIPPQQSPPGQPAPSFGVNNYYGENGATAVQQNLPPLGSFSPPANGAPSRPFYTEQPVQPIGLPPVTRPDGHIDQKLQSQIVTQGISNDGVPLSDLRTSVLQNDDVTQYQQQQQQQLQQVATLQDGQYFENAIRPEIDLDPSIVPVIPEPTEPIEDSLSLIEETNFFDKAKKFIGSKQVYAEFLKILNLFSQDLLEIDELVGRVEHYLGANKELFSWFKNFVGFQDKPKHIENIVHEKHRLDLDLCEACGPSYKKLPKADTFMPCSGRDEMCWEVLNDEWVGHPVWASEDSGFIAHRKNQYEETLFKIEEERHEYDFYIESNLRTIQTLETIASKIASMTEEEKANFKLPPGLGHTSLTIYKKIIRKIYDKERGFEIIDALHEYPAVAVPVVLKRLKQKDEEWRRAQREWNKVWRELEQKVYFKSLDHLGLTFKQADKKLLTTKQLISEISSIKVDQTNKRMHWLTPKPKSQLSYEFPDRQVLYDILGLAEIFINNTANYSNRDKDRLKDFLKSFVSLFFSIPSQDIYSAVNIRVITNEKSKSALQINSSEANPKKRPREIDIRLKDVLHRGKYQNLKQRTNGVLDEHNDSVASEEVLADEEDKSAAEEEEDIRQEAKKPWLLGNLVEEANAQGKIHNRKCFNLFANTNIYVFFRHLTTLFERLYEVKQINEETTKEINSRKVVQFAKDLNLISQQLKDMGLDFNGTDAFEQMLHLCKRLIEGDIEHQWFEESLRQAYNNKAFKLYTVDKVVQALVKHAHAIMTDSKSTEIMVLFEKDRLQMDTSAKDQILYRLQVRSHMTPIENMFRIEFNRQTNHVCIQYIAVDDLTLAEPKSLEDKWKYYVTSYSLSHPTEGIPQDELEIPFLERIIEEEEEYADEDEKNEENKGKYSLKGISGSTLKIKIDPETYALEIEPGSYDVFSRVSINKFPLTVEENLYKQKKMKKLDAVKKFLEGKRGWKRFLNDEEANVYKEKFIYLKKNGTLKGFSALNKNDANNENVGKNQVGDEMNDVDNREATKVRCVPDNDDKGNDTTTEDIDAETSAAALAG